MGIWNPFSVVDIYIIRLSSVILEIPYFSTWLVNGITTAIGLVYSHQHNTHSSSSISCSAICQVAFLLPKCLANVFLNCLAPKCFSNIHLPNLKFGTDSGLIDRQIIFTNINRSNNPICHNMCANHFGTCLANI